MPKKNKAKVEPKKIEVFKLNYYVTNKHKYDWHKLEKETKNEST